MKARYFRAFCILTMALFLLSGCAASLDQRIHNANTLMHDAHLIPATLKTTDFSLFSARNFTQPEQDSLTIIIEGDGYSWASRNKPTANPTPKDPIGLRLLARTASPAIYLARPCQFIHSPRCHQQFWTDGRFSDPVIESYRQAIQQIMMRYNVRNLHFMGYSGGGYLAMVMAAHFNQVTSSVTTIAGVLNPDDWTQFHYISPVMVPMPSDDILRYTGHIAFAHICGGRDQVVPCTLTERFVAYGRSLGFTNHILTRDEQADHGSIWSGRLGQQ